MEMGTSEHGSLLAVRILLAFSNIKAFCRQGEEQRGFGYGLPKELGDDGTLGLLGLLRRLGGMSK